MLARRLTTVLPAMPLTGDPTAVVTTRPFRGPHQSMADGGLIGGQVPTPGQGRGPTTASSASMHAPSSDGMGLQGCGNR
jgi:hypothetical protein